MDQTSAALCVCSWWQHPFWCVITLIVPELIANVTSSEHIIKNFVSLLTLSFSWSQSHLTPHLTWQMHQGMARAFMYFPHMDTCILINEEFVLIAHYSAWNVVKPLKWPSRLFTCFSIACFQVLPNIFALFKVRTWNSIPQMRSGSYAEIQCCPFSKCNNSDLKQTILF